MMEKKEYLEKLGQQIVVIRKAKGISQVELANSLNMEDSSLRRIEKGRVNSTILMLRAIANGLGVKIEELLPQEN